MGAITSEICPSATRKSVAARRSRMSACGLCDSQGSLSKAGRVATPPTAPGKMPLKNRSVSASASARRLESVTKNAGRRNSRVKYAATRAFATSCRPVIEMWLAPERKAASAPSIAAWRRTASNLSRTAGSIMRGRSGIRARGARPFAYFLQNGRFGIAGHDGDGEGAPASSFHFFAAYHLVPRPIATLNQPIREQTGNHFAGRQVIEDHHGIHRFQSRENFRALAFRDNRAGFALQLTHAGVAVQPNNQHIAQGARQFQAANVPGMKQVKAAVGEDDAAAVAFPAAKPQNRLLKCQECRIQRISIQAVKHQSQLRQKLVYHPREVRRATARSRVVGHSPLTSLITSWQLLPR